MKTGVFLLAGLIVTCAGTLAVGGRNSNRIPANDAQDYACAVLAVNVPARARPLGIVQIPSPAANFLEIGYWARDPWHRFWGEPLDRRDCL